QGKVIAPRGGAVTGARGHRVPVDMSLLTVGSVLFDAVYVPGGDASAEALAKEAAARLFVSEAYKHCKAIAVTGAGAKLLPDCIERVPPSRSGGRTRILEDGVIAGEDGQVAALATAFIAAIAAHRHFAREPKAERVAV